MTMNQIHGTETGLTTEHTQVVIDQFGRAVIEGKNFSGSACSMMGEALRRAIGGGAKDTSDPKPEMYQTGSQENYGTNW